MMDHLHIALPTVAIVGLILVAALDGRRRPPRRHRAPGLPRIRAVRSGVPTDPRIPWKDAA